MRRVLPLILVLAIFSCSKAASPASGAAGAAAPAAGTPAGAQAGTPPPAAAFVKPLPAQLPDVLARVNGTAIEKGELEKAIQAIESQNGPAPADQKDRIYRSILDQIIDYRLLVQESQARKIAVPDADIDARVAQIRSQFPTEDAFKQALAAQKVTVEQIKSDARTEIMVTKMLQGEVEGKVAVTPENVTSFYQNNPDQFKQGERVHASHILLSFPQNADAAAKQLVRTKAEGILKDVKAGKDFAALAKANSQDTGSAPGGGDLGFFERGQMVGPFEQAAFGLAAGQTSELVETQFGYHIIKVLEKQAPSTAPLDEEMKTRIQQFLENQSRQQATQAFVQTLRAKGKVEILV